MEEKKLSEWFFEFEICPDDPAALIPESKCEELLNLIIDWAEENGYGIGGHYRELDDEEQE